MTRNFVTSGNNTLRISSKRISVGPQQKHYNKMGRGRKVFDRLHVHVEKRKAGFDINNRKGGKAALYSKYRAW